MQHAYLVTLLLAVVPPILANDPELVPDPLTRFGWLLEEGETFTSLSYGDVNNDGRMDLVVTTSAGRLVVLSAVAERQHHRVLEPDPPEEDEDEPGVIWNAAVQSRSGGDLLLVETDNGLWQGTVTVDQDDRWIWSYVRLDAGVARQVLYDNLSDHVWALGWRVSSSLDWVQPLLFDRDSGGLLIVGPYLQITATLGPVELIDYEGVGLCGLAVTVPGGCAVLDTAGNVVAQLLRATSNPDLSGDRLARIRDADGSELLAWMHEVASGTELRLASSTTTTQTLTLPTLGAGTRVLAAELSATQMADLVLVNDGDDDLVVYRATTSTPRYDPTNPELLQVVGAVDKSESAGLVRGGVFVDLDRDGDVDYAAITDTALQLARLDQVDDGHLVPTVDIVPEAEYLSYADFAQGTSNAVPVTVLLQPAGWTTHPTLNTATRLDYRVYTGATLNPLLRATNPVYPGSITNLTWPITIPWSTILPNGELVLESGADPVWYVEVELVHTPSQGGGDVRYPTATFAIAPAIVDMLALEDACAPTGPLWNGPWPDGGNDGNGTFGTVGHSPRIPRLPPPPPPISQPGGN